MSGPSRPRWARATPSTSRRAPSSPSRTRGQAACRSCASSIRPGSRRTKRSSRKPVGESGKSMPLEPAYAPPVRPGWLRRLLDVRKRMSWEQAFTALKYPNYRLWFWSQMFSLFGTWMESTALGFLVFDLTKSPAYLGLVGFASGAPTWLFTLYAGVIADRMPRRRLLIWTQTVMMILAFAVAALTFLHWVRPWHILGLAFLLGTANAFEAPARQSFVLEMVDHADMTNAIALNAAMFNTAMAVGPAAGGLIYGFLGPAWCFAINGATFIAVIVALRRMTLTPFERPAVR